MGKKWIFLLLVVLMSFAGCSSTESEKASKNDDKTTESKEVVKEMNTPAKEPIAPVADMRTQYLKDMNRELKRLYDALKSIQTQLDAHRQDNQNSKTQAWKDEMIKGYSAVESANTNIKTYPNDKIPSNLKENHQKLVEGLGLLVKIKEFLIRGLPDNNEEVISTGNMFVKLGTNLVDPATNFILDQE
jgi:TolA-binding protein